MLFGFVPVFASLLAGEALASALRLPVPGCICGMALLLAYLTARGESDAQLETAADGLLAHLPLLFAPAGVGVMAYGDVFAVHGLTIAAVLAVGTTLTLAAVAWTAEWTSQIDVVGWLDYAAQRFATILRRLAASGQALRQRASDIFHGRQRQLTPYDFL